MLKKLTPRFSVEKHIISTLALKKWDLEIEFISMKFRLVTYWVYYLYFLINWIKLCHNFHNFAVCIFFCFILCRKRHAQKISIILTPDLMHATNFIPFVRHWFFTPAINYLQKSNFSILTFQFCFKKIIFRHFRLLTRNPRSEFQRIRFFSSHKKHTCLKLFSSGDRLFSCT